MKNYATCGADLSRTESAGQLTSDTLAEFWRPTNKEPPLHDHTTCSDLRLDFAAAEVPWLALQRAEVVEIAGQPPRHGTRHLFKSPIEHPYAILSNLSVLAG